ncbi:zinc ABC transporter ATP-binding protein ZnuC [Salinibius halmophilus]|uniref:zinc ABC transporter ATP-binding protein ZnuC n=1 Tax=Salinibius halmophilus TaxID=1853216 RepID=UPI000E66E4C2|nr:zinc ABC transporter ATP-binding protein ZnuC [Salinibius halmophilus]
MTRLQFEHVQHRFGSALAVQDISFSLNNEEILTIIGPNGAGKSTILRLALGIYQPTAGRIQLAADTHIGYMPQKLAIDPTLPLTVGRFMQLNHKVSQKDARIALARTEVEHLWRDSVQDLSGGELQRVLLARAAVRKPNLLVLDEPVQGVDYRGEAALYELISQLRDELKSAVLMVSHDLHVVMASSDNVLCVNGHICCHGHPDQVSDHPEYVSLFGKREAQALGVYVHDHDHDHDCGGQH